MGIRSFRDLFAGPLFAASLDAKKAPAALFFAADLPGAFISVLVLLFYTKIRDNGRAVHLMLLTILCGLLFTFGSTALFLAPFSIGGTAWQLMLGTGLFVSYSVMGSPLYERIFAVGKVKGTISFLVFTADLTGYFATLGIFAYSIFGGNKSSDDDDISDSGGRDEDDGNDDEDVRRYNKLILGQFLIVFWSCGLLAAFLNFAAMAYFWWRLGGRSSKDSKDDTSSDPSTVDKEVYCTLNSSREQQSSEETPNGEFEANDSEFEANSDLPKVRLSKDGDYISVNPLLNDEEKNEEGTPDVVEYTD